MIMGGPSKSQIADTWLKAETQNQNFLLLFLFTVLICSCGGENHQPRKLLYSFGRTEIFTGEIIFTGCGFVQGHYTGCVLAG